MIFSIVALVFLTAIACITRPVVIVALVVLIAWAYATINRYADPTAQ